MLVIALVTVYLACGAVLLAALVQDRVKGTRRHLGGRDAHREQTSDLVFRTQF